LCHKVIFLIEQEGRPVIERLATSPFSIETLTRNTCATRNGFGYVIVVTIGIDILIAAALVPNAEEHTAFGTVHFLDSTVSKTVLASTEIC
jgi:hypothetical protein